MAAPLVPIAWTAVRLGAVAATAYYISRRTRPAPKHAWREAALDDTAEGLEITTDRSGAETNAHTAARFRRVIRLAGSRGLEIDIAALGRIRFRRTD